jgi:hypothetical protein
MLSSVPHHFLEHTWAHILLIGRKSENKKEITNSGDNPRLTESMPHHGGLHSPHMSCHLHGGSRCQRTLGSCHYQKDHHHCAMEGDVQRTNHQNLNRHGDRHHCRMPHHCQVCHLIHPHMRLIMCADLRSNHNGPRSTAKH